jgi:curli biogenesis system outer membrane secretion channel CsgG
MADLSPAAQAVLDVYWKNVGMPSALAQELGFTNTPLVVALRAAADQVVPETKAVDSDLDYGAWEQQQRTRAEFLAIAAELEGQP